MKLLLVLISAFFILSTTAFASPCPPNLDKSKPINEVFTRLIDVDSDGIQDKIELHVYGKNFNAPFNWNLRISSKGKVIFQKKRSNERIEPFLSEENYIDGCTGYADCKCKWFFHDYLDQMVIKMSSDNVGVFDKAAPNSIYVIAKRHLGKEYARNPKLVEAAIKNAAERLLSGKAVAIQAFDEPEITTPPMVWMPEFSQFVPIYED